MTGKAAIVEAVNRTEPANPPLVVDDELVGHVMLVRPGA
jgi:hypothetical protein